jgi:arsenite/tail-anchored protein-transporting ATPase
VLPDRLLEKRLLFVTGKGGVGKTTFCGALSLHAAATGRRVLLCEVSSSPAFGQIFGDAPVGFEPIAVGPRLWATNCESRQCLVSFLERFVKVRRIARALVKNRISGHFLEAAPGVLETVVLERVAALALEGRGDHAFDLVLVDLPSSGHAVSFLDCPRTLARVLQTGRLADYLHALAGRLADPALSELVIVTQPEEMPVQETIELWATARERLDIPLRTVVINRLRRLPLGADLAQRLQSAEPAGHSLPELRAASLIAGWSTREERFVERLKAAVDAEYAELPWLPDHGSEGHLLERLAAHWSGGAR